MTQVDRIPAVELERNVAEVLRVLNLNPRDPVARAMVAVAHRYNLDPLLGHVQVLKGSVYITRDGMLRVAHRSGMLDGIVTEEQRESENGYSATVSVWRKDCRYPFTYKGGCGANEPQAKAGHGAEMALARAERRALKRAFDIPLPDEPEWPAATTPYEAPEVLEAPTMPETGPAAVTAHSEGPRDEMAVPDPDADPGEYWTTVAALYGVPAGALVARARRFCQDTNTEPRPHELGEIPTEGPIADALRAWFAELEEPF